MDVVRTVEIVLGIFLVLAVLVDVFESVVVPRPTPGLRASSFLARVTWPAWRRVALSGRLAERRERLLADYAPLFLVALLLAWVVGLAVGYGLVLHALRDEIRPRPDDVGTAIYFAATSLFAIGFGDVVASEGAARLVAIAAAASGLFVVALSIAFLFSLFASFQRREALVVTLDERAGAPPSGVRLLETYATHGMVDDLTRTFAAWEVWAAEVLDSHISYPILAWFRSTHDNESWISALGAMLDASTLVVTTIDGVPTGPARMLWAIGNHVVEDFTQFFRLPSEPGAGVEREEFDAARATLAAAGYRLRAPEESWRAFVEVRASYAASLNALAQNWAVPPALWIGDRSYMRHGRDAAVAERTAPTSPSS